MTVSGVDTEVELFLARSSIFSFHFNVLDMDICPTHRSSLDICRRRGLARCLIPGQLSKHVRKFRITGRGIRICSECRITLGEHVVADYQDPQLIALPESIYEPFLAVSSSGVIERTLQCNEEETISSSLDAFNFLLKAVISDSCSHPQAEKKKLKKRGEWAEWKSFKPSPSASLTKNIILYQQQLCILH
ncbi:hypothetical protein P5673_006569 [Acropora cervicornis]|uniref:Uncharacterized protein n=1 Tax=Acropora cervicornis TaxID=6130 RepID=A0AAD9QX17_ACRCE|nr:hypothetical protein P5673_006569 [Acropora cervicornis]